MHLYEDLFALGKSEKLCERIRERDRVLNRGNKRVGIAARRGDGTFGELVPGENPILDPGFQVATGIIATVEIGIEVKIMAKAMIKQIDRVIGDLHKQISHFKHGGDTPICVGIVGVNHAPRTTSYEGIAQPRHTESDTLIPPGSGKGHDSLKIGGCNPVRRISDSSLPGHE